jgi:hypothetical protein
VAVATALIVLVPAVVKFRNDLPVGSVVRNVLADIRRDQSLHVRAERDQGYYEDLTNTKSYNLALWELYNRRPTNWVLSIGQTDAGRSVPDKFHQFELVPSKRVEFLNQEVSTNRWGMRDRDYEQKKPPGVYRVAILGSSISMGWGVADDESYENLLEDRLNSEFGAGSYERVEILNFSVAGFSDFQKLWAFERALDFEPDVVLWEMHATGHTWMVNHLTRVLRQKVPIPYPELREILDAHGISGRISGLTMRSRLREMSPELLSWIWDRMKRECDARGIELEVVLLPRADSMRADNERLAEMGEFARAAGLPVLDLRRAFSGVADRSSVATAPGDAHPNAYGHRLLADELRDEMLTLAHWQTVLGERQADSQQAEKEESRSAR